jgi:hypothetical protein
MTAPVLTPVPMYPIGSVIYVVSAASFGIAIATITAVDVASVNPTAPPVITYSVRFSNPVRSANIQQFDSSMVFPDVTTAVAAYAPLIS